MVGYWYLPEKLQICRQIMVYIGTQLVRFAVISESMGSAFQIPCVGCTIVESTLQVATLLRLR